MIWHENEGAGPRTVLLLHGLGATAAVWSGLRRELHGEDGVHCIAADLSGHGRSDWQPHYSVGQLAAQLADLVRGRSELFIVGHSLGAYVGLALASGWFGVQVRGVLGIGPKITWSEADLQASGELAARALRWYASSDEAWARYRRVCGLDVNAAADEQWLARGIVQAEQGWRLSQDSRTFGVAGAPFGTLAAGAKARVMLARGEGDAMVSLEELRSHDVDAADIAGAGHNAHVENPAAVVSLLRRLFEAG